MPYIKPKKNSFLFDKVLRGLKGNALGCVMVKPMWALLGGIIAGYLYELKPIYPFIISLLIFIVSMVFAIFIWKIHTKLGKINQ
jgi:hypothetical protein